MNKIVICKIAVVFMLGSAVWAGQDFYVSPTGDDLDSGSSRRPLRTLKTAVSKLDSGDTLYLMEGRYEECLELKRLERVTVTAVSDARVTIAGTRPLPARWKHWENGIWKQQVDFDLWQLFEDDKLVYVARWPDASFEDGSIWRMTRSMRSGDGGGYDEKKQTWDGKTRPGLMYDDSFHPVKAKGFREGDTRTWNEGPQPESLADSGKDFAGAIAVLNIGHWVTWARPITKHQSGSDHFSYDLLGLKVNKNHPFSAYYVLGLAALDRPNEWWFDALTRTVFFMPPTGMDPNTLNLQGRIRDDGLTVTDCKDVRISGIEFVGAGFTVQDSSRLQVENCDFRYAATHKFMQGAIDWFSERGKARDRNRMPVMFGGADNLFLNCTFSFCNAPISFGGNRPRVENCSFSDIEWDVNSGGGSGSIMLGENGIFRRNTVTRCGNSEGIRPIEAGTTIVLNRISDMGNLQHDGSAINAGMRNHSGVLVAHNWTYDCNRQGLRFDYAGSGVTRDDGLIHGDGVCMYNVTWNTSPGQIKGDRHLLLNNTVVNVNRYRDPNEEPLNITLQGFKCMHDIDGNMNSVARNNLANRPAAPII